MASEVNQRLEAVVGRVHFVAADPQVAGQQFGLVGVVFHQQRPPLGFVCRDRLGRRVGGAIQGVKLPQRPVQRGLGSLHVSGGHFLLGQVNRQLGSIQAVAQFVGQLGWLLPAAQGVAGSRDADADLVAGHAQNLHGDAKIGEQDFVLRTTREDEHAGSPFL